MCQAAQVNTGEAQSNFLPVAGRPRTVGNDNTLTVKQDTFRPRLGGGGLREGDTEGEEVEAGGGGGAAEWAEK